MEQTESATNAEEQNRKGHVRKRKKQYYKRIRQQMEFYFGDANLSKDRFLNKLLAVNQLVSQITQSNVPLEVFMNFNKMKEMSRGVEDIQRAVEGSEMLELSTDKQSVRRLTEIRKKEDLDEYMVYELLPSNSTHESVRQQFKQFGNLSYVSLPRYRTSGRIKEFAFIEFEDKSSVAKCIDAFRKFNAVIGCSQNPENLTSVTSYVKEQEELEKQGEGDEKDEDGNNTEEKETTEDKDETEVKKETKSIGEVSDEKNVNDEVVSDDQGKKVLKKRASEIPKKRMKKENTEVEPDQEEDRESKKKRKRIEKDSENEPEVKRGRPEEHEQEKEQNEAEDKDCEVKEGQGDTTDDRGSANNEEQDRKKKKNKRRKRKTVPETVPDNNESLRGKISTSHGPMSTCDDTKKMNDPNQSLAVLRVTTKTEWKRLRNLYLTLQRQKYSEVKKLLQLNKSGEGGKKSTLPPSTVRPVTMKPKDDLPQPPKKICTRNINFYGANRDEHNANNYECSIINENKVVETQPTETVEKKHKAKDLQFEFEPGLIVKVLFSEPCTDVSDFKSEMKQYPFVQYVDVKEGQPHAHVRVDTPSSAPMLIKRCAPVPCVILSGDVEKKYWTKIAKDREQKLSKSVRLPRNRARKMRNIIKNIAEINVEKTDNKITVTHIRFDDE